MNKTNIKMRHLLKIIITVAMLAGTFTVWSQIPNISVSQPEVKISGGMVNVKMVVDAGLVDIGCNGSYRLVPFIEKEGVRLQLPEIVYAGSQRYKFDRRRELLSSNPMPEAYRIFTKADKRPAGIVEYDITVPYMAWMGGSKLKYEWVQYTCEGEQVLPGGFAETVSDSSSLSMSSGPVMLESVGFRRAPDPVLYADVVFYSPEPEKYRDRFTQKMVEGKRRNVSADLYINFPQDVPDIIPGYMDNATELRKADSLMKYILGNDLMSATTLTITGYASPEGALWRNANLARYRADNMKMYIDQHYDISSIPVTVGSVPVDWQGLKEKLITGNIPYRDDILHAIDDIPGDEDRERIISRIGDGEPHRRLLEEVYPKLRRTVLKAEFTVAGLTPEKARELLYTNPGLLSIEEMYTVSSVYEVGSDDYVDVFAIAAKEFPGDFTANNNAAAAYLQRGDAENAYKYIIKIAHDSRAYSNVGTYYYLLGDTEQAKKYFRMADEENIPGAAQRLRMIEDK